MREATLKTAKKQKQTSTQKCWWRKSTLWPLKPPVSCFSSSNASPSEGAPLSGSYGCTPQSLPKFWHSSHELLRDNGFTQQGYHKYRRRCLNGTDGARRVHTAASCSSQTPLNMFDFLSSLVVRAQTVGRGSVSGDEHPVQVLVLLPEGQLQQEDVRGVQAVFGGRRQRKQQVGVCWGAGLLLFSVTVMFALGFGFFGAEVQMWANTGCFFTSSREKSC